MNTEPKKEPSPDPESLPVNHPLVGGYQEIDLNTPDVQSDVLLAGDPNCCGAILPNYDSITCLRRKGHLGWHLNGITLWPDKEGPVDTKRPEKPPVTAICGARSEAPYMFCTLPELHDGDHRSGAWHWSDSPRVPQPICDAPPAPDCVKQLASLSTAGIPEIVQVYSRRAREAARICIVAFAHGENKHSEGFIREAHRTIMLELFGIDIEHLQKPREFGYSCHIPSKIEPAPEVSAPPMWFGEELQKCYANAARQGVIISVALSMRDGLCPKCGRLSIDVIFDKEGVSCRNCGYSITAEEMQAAVDQYEARAEAFAVFEEWRASLKSPEPPAPCFTESGVQCSDPPTDV